MLVFEDMHWADDHLIEFVDHLVDWAAGVPLLVVCTARPELLTRRPDWGGGKPNALTVSLSPLSDEDTARLLARAARLGPAGGDSGRAARPRGREPALRRGVRADAPRSRRASGELPETVQGLIAARLDLLEHDAEGAAPGRRRDREAVLDRRARQPWPIAPGSRQRLHALERKEFVRRERVELGRRRPRVRVPPPARPRRRLRPDPARRPRRRSTSLAAGWIERLGRREDHAEMLAHHYLQALELTEAPAGSTAAFAGAAADGADRRRRPRRRAQRVRRGRSLLPGCARAARRGTTRAGPLLLRLGQALYDPRRDRHERPRARRGRAARRGDVEGAAEAETDALRAVLARGDRDAAMEHIVEALGGWSIRFPPPRRRRV